MKVLSCFLDVKGCLFRALDTADCSSLEERNCFLQVRNGITLSAGSFSAQALKDLIRHELACTVNDQHGRYVCLTPTGHAHLKRHDHYNDKPRQLNDHNTPFTRQHRAMERVLIDDAEGGHVINLNTLESPLAWLYRRKDKNGQPLINATQFMAGERLRHEMHRASLLPHMGVDWGRASVQTSAAGSREGLNMSDAVVAARQSVNKALVAVGSDVSGLLIDVCGFLKSLKIIEIERSWPARSAKIILAMALSRLADHYGLSQEARGKKYV